ncbi:uncharacterized protein TNCV_142371 [Trichonephila clavipes]|nr:uncharacterized protein TNCV_142371 [Trichonephila clavipes]
MTTQRYVHDILQPHVLSLMQRLPGAIFQQDNARPHQARVSQYYHHTVTTHLWGSFGMASLASHEFEQTRGKVTANMERNVSIQHRELLCLNAR